MPRLPALLLPIALFLASCAPAVSPPGTTPAPAEAPPADGERLARARCTSCHLYTPPEALTRSGWKPVHLHMVARLGLADDFRNNPPEGYGEQERLVADYFHEKLGDLNLVPSPALLSRGEFIEIRDYLDRSAPQTPLPQADKPPTRTGETPFRLGHHVPFDPALHEAVTLVRIDEERRYVFAGGVKGFDESRNYRPPYLMLLDADGNMVDEMGLDSAPVSLERAGRDYFVTTIGSLATIQSSVARVTRIVVRNDQLLAKVLVDKQLRASGSTVHTRADGTRLIALSGFGYYLGELVLFEESGNRIVSRRTLLEEPGAAGSRFGDFDGDGTLDLLCLFSQHVESLLLFPDVESGLHEPVELLKQHPSWGFSSFDLADMNGDGTLDLVVTNGDNSDYPDPPLKSYHGVRIYLGRPAEAGATPRFEESFFRPVHGAYKVLARDFDLDGDVDLAIVGRYLDEAASPRESFLYMENRSTAGSDELEFDARVMPELEASDLVTMDTGDLDGDGDLDIVLGSSTPLSEKRPLEVTPLGIAYLINQTR